MSRRLRANRWFHPGLKPREVQKLKGVWQVDTRRCASQQGKPRDVLCVADGSGEVLMNTEMDCLLTDAQVADALTQLLAMHGCPSRC